MQGFSILLLLLIFVLPSKYSKSLQIWHGLLTHFHPSFSISPPCLPSTLYILFISFLPPLFPPQSPSPKTIITSLAMQLADRLILQKELNPTAQHQQIILSAKPAFPFWNNALIYTRVTLELVQGKVERRGRWKERHKDRLQQVKS